MYQPTSFLWLVYCTAHDDWNVTSYQGLFCPLTKRFVTDYRGVYKW